MTRTNTATRRRERARTRTPDAIPVPTTSGDCPVSAADTTSDEQRDMTLVAARKVAKSASPRPATKLASIIAALRSDEGATIAELVALTGWKTNSVRGVLAGALKTKFGLTITSTKTDGVRTYRVAPDAEG